MFTITKSKGKAYKADTIQQAVKAFRNKHSLTLWGDKGNIILTRIEYTRINNGGIWKYLEKTQHYYGKKEK